MYMTRLINLLLPGDTFFFSRYPSVALARNFINERATVVVTHPVVRFLFRLNDELVGKWPTEYNTYTI